MDEAAAPPGQTFNMTIQVPAIAGVISKIGAHASAIVQVDKDGTVHYQMQAPDQWTCAMMCAAMCADLGIQFPGTMKQV